MSEPKKRKGIEWPTSGRILRYTYSRDDYSQAGEGTSRPCVVVDSYESDDGPEDPLGELYDVVVFTAGLRDFNQGREGWMGILSRRGVRLTMTARAGAISWPPRT